MDNERLKKQMDFILEMDKMKSIMRQTYLANGERKENDAGTILASGFECAAFLRNIPMSRSMC